MKLYDEYEGRVWAPELVAARAQGKRIVRDTTAPVRYHGFTPMFEVKVLHHDNERLAAFASRKPAAALNEIVPYERAYYALCEGDRRRVLEAWNEDRPVR